MYILTLPKNNAHDSNAILDEIASMLKLPIKITLPALYPNFNSNNAFNREPLWMHETIKGIGLGCQTDDQIYIHFVLTWIG